jgi:hypothetical protein
MKSLHLVGSVGVVDCMHMDVLNQALAAHGMRASSTMQCVEGKT